MKAHLALAALALAAAFVPAVGADGAPAGKVLFFERDLLYDKIATHGFDVVNVRGAQYKEIEVRVDIVGPCTSMDGTILVLPTPPPPIPPAVIGVQFTCGGAGDPIHVGLPILSAYQAEDRPLVLDFSGTGRGLAHVSVYGTPW